MTIESTSKINLWVDMRVIEVNGKRVIQEGFWLRNNEFIALEEMVEVSNSEFDYFKALTKDVMVFVKRECESNVEVWLKWLAK